MTEWMVKTARREDQFSRHHICAAGPHSTLEPAGALHPDQWASLGSCIAMNENHKGLLVNGAK